MEYKGYGCKVTIDGQNVHFSQTFLKLDCLLSEISSVLIFDPTLTKNGSITLNAKGKKLQLFFLKKQAEEFKKLYHILSSNAADTNKDPMKTAKGMYQYCVDNKMGFTSDENLLLKHFEVIANNLMDSENVLMTFTGMHDYVSATKHDSNFAYAVTNKRIIMAQKNTIAGEKCQTVYLDNLNDITYNSGIATGVLIIDTIKEHFNIGLDKVSAQNVNSKIHEAIDSIRNSREEKPQQVVQATSTADELRKFKELLDDGIITQDEFDTKKKELLGL